MSNYINLAKKLKALAERGVGGEKETASKFLDDFLKKHNINPKDLESDPVTMMYFNVKQNELRIFNQCVKRVRYDLQIYGEIPKKTQRDYGIDGNYGVECTISEFIEIKSRFETYIGLYFKELEVFITAFCTANDLLAHPPEDKIKSVKDLTEEEIEVFRRANEMSNSILKRTHRKKIEK